MHTRLVMCIRNDGAEDLELPKIYQVLPDEVASSEDHLRVIDESGEDYLYPSDYLVSIELPEALEQAFVVARYDNPTEPIAQDDWAALRDATKP